MANKREIKNRLRGIRKTQQITRAMKMVAAVKLRHAQAALLNSRPYAERMRSLAAGLLARIDPPPSDHPFFSQRPARNALLIVVASDRGLCGNMNANIFRQVLRAVADLNAPGAKGEKPETHLFLVGRKARDFFKARQNVRAEHLSCRTRETVNFAEVDAGRLGAQCADLYRKGEFDRIELFYNGISSGLHHQPVRATLLPLDFVRMRQEAGALGGSVIFEPAGAEMLDDLIHGYIASEMRRIMMEAEVAEHAARMLMMDLATRNADDLIAAMQLTMNKLRQLAITSELEDITTGAEAVG
jgi:F-type H+-transporting ATPase subunit gamma